MSDDLFKRVPTNDEKYRYRALWGGIHPQRCFLGMMVVFVLGIWLGMSLA